MTLSSSSKQNSNINSLQTIIGVNGVKILVSVVFSKSFTREEWERINPRLKFMSIDTKQSFKLYEVEVDLDEEYDAKRQPKFPILGNTTLDWYNCRHEWEEVIDPISELELRCKLCGCPGEDEGNGEVYWPAT